MSITIQKYMKKWLFILVLFSTSLVGQEPFMKHLTNEKGLPSMTIYQILQDKEGYIWLGSAKGLSRYDGRKFVNIDLSSMLDKEIIHMQEDFLGRIWINNLSGQVAWIEDMELHFPTLEALPEGSLPIRLKIHGDDLFLSHKKLDRKLLIYKLHADGSISKKEYTDTGVVNLIISQLSYGDTIYFSAFGLKDNSLRYYYFHNDSIKQEYIETDFEGYDVGDGKFLLLEVDNKNRFLLDNGDYVLRYDKDKDKIERIYDCAENRINDCKIRDGKIWLFTKNGILVFDEETLEKEKEFLSGINSHVMFEDREHNLWFPTAANGIFLLYNMNTLTYNSENSNIPKSDIYSLYYEGADSTLYIGMSNGYLSKYDQRKKTFSNYKLPLSGRVVSMDIDENGFLWLGLDDGMCLMDTSNDQIVRINSSSAIKVVKELSNLR